VAKSHLQLVTPSTEIRTVRPTRRPNTDLRTREYLTEAEVERLLKATKGNRWAHRDATMILLAYRHGLRASELTDLRWDQVDFTTATLHVRRVKQGSPSTHPILGDELRWLRRLQREQEPKSPFVFTSERGSPFTTAGFARMVERAAAEAGFGFKEHPHMLRHACGFALASKGHDTRALQAYLGHKNIQHTVRYTELSPLQDLLAGLTACFRAKAREGKTLIWDPLFDPCWHACFRFCPLQIDGQINASISSHCRTARDRTEGQLCSSDCRDVIEILKA
jgi:integrase